MAVDKLVDSTQLDGYFSDIADAIRGKNGSSDTYTPAQMPSAIDNIPSGGDDSSLINLLNGNGDVVIPDNTSKIASYKFYSHTFTNTTLTLPSTIQSIGSYAFEYSNLKELDLSRCSNLHEIGSNAFYSANKLQTITFGNYDIKIRYQYAFYSCTLLKEIVMPEGYLDNNQQYTFAYCTNLELIDLGSRTYGGGCFSNVFTSTSSLKALVIRYTGDPIVLYYSTNFSGSKIAAGTGYIYVPRASVDAYKAATNWSTYASQIRAVEDYTDDGTLTGKFIMPT